MSRVLAVIAAVVMLASGTRRSVAFEREEHEPRLILPGDRSVAAGEWIDLRWSEADDIRELEILLSVDGGRTYGQCITPQLDPDRHGFRWRVPDLAGGAVRLRIRFNRAGREIEGAPSEPVAVTSGTAGRAPLGLPPMTPAPEDRDRERSPRAPDRTRGAGPAEDSDEAGPAPPAPLTGLFRAPTRAPVPAAMRAIHAPFAAPRAVPLRT